MASNVRYEWELYEPMRLWLHQYLADKYCGSEIITIDSHARTLDVFLAENNVLDFYPQVVGLGIQIDVLGIIKSKRICKLAFIEAKKTQLNLHDLGQLWAYCKLCDPEEAFLLSSIGLGSLDKVLNLLAREDLLDFGNGKAIKKMIVGKWNIGAGSVDFSTVIPKI